MDDVDDKRKNELANPFFECISDSQWKKICNKVHFYTGMIDQIIQNKTYNLLYNFPKSKWIIHKYLDF